MVIVDPDGEEVKLVLEHRRGIRELGRSVAWHGAPAAPGVPVEGIHVVMMVIDADAEEVESILKDCRRVRQNGGAAAGQHAPADRRVHEGVD